MDSLRAQGAMVASDISGEAKTFFSTYRCYSRLTASTRARFRRVSRQWHCKAYTQRHPTYVAPSRWSAGRWLSTTRLTHRRYHSSGPIVYSPVSRPKPSVRFCPVAWVLVSPVIWGRRAAHLPVGVRVVISEYEYVRMVSASQWRSHLSDTF